MDIVVQKILLVAGAAIVGIFLVWICSKLLRKKKTQENDEKQADEQSASQPTAEVQPASPSSITVAIQQPANAQSFVIAVQPTSQTSAQPTLQTSAQPTLQTSAQPPVQYSETISAPQDITLAKKSERFFLPYGDGPFTSCKEITETMRMRKNVEVVERAQQPQLPVSLKVKGKTFAMLYGTESGVVMIVRLFLTEAKMYIKKYPQMIKSKFPHGQNWYSILVDENFDNESVYEILDTAMHFCSNNY